MFTILKANISIQRRMNSKIVQGNVGYVTALLLTNTDLGQSVDLLGLKLLN